MMMLKSESSWALYVSWFNLLRLATLMILKEGGARGKGNRRHPEPKVKDLKFFALFQILRAKALRMTGGAGEWVFMRCGF